MNKKELILECFRKMDMRILSVVLNDGQTYEHMEKDLFLEKINQLFQLCKELGDTELIVCKGTCQSSLCSKSGCSGYSFTGNQSRNHFDLIFLESDDDFTNIFQCRDFRPSDTTIEQDQHLTFQVFEDEKAEFHPPVEYLIESQKCQQAIEEFHQYKQTVITTDVYLGWHEKYQDLYSDIVDLEDTYSEYNAFVALYNYVDILCGFVTIRGEAEKAIEEFRSLRSEDELLAWLDEYGALAWSLSCFSALRGDDSFSDTMHPLRVHDVIIDPTELTPLYKFSFLFDTQFTDMENKYPQLG
jgi:hypothetical protein